MLCYHLLKYLNRQCFNEPAVNAPEIVFVPVVDTSAVVSVPETVAEPSTTNPSLMFMVDESAAVKVVPKNVTPSTSTLPVPFALISRSEFDAFELIVLSLIVTPSMSAWPVTVCVPTVVNAAVVSVPEKLPVPSTTNPSLMFIVLESADEIVVPLIVMLDPIIVLPVPPGVILMSAFEDDVILLS